MTDTTPAGAESAELTDTEQLCALLAAADATAHQLWALAQDQQLPHEIRTHAHAAAHHAELAIREAEQTGHVTVTRDRDKTILRIEPATGG